MTLHLPDVRAALAVLRRLQAADAVQAAPRGDAVTSAPTYAVEAAIVRLELLEKTMVSLADLSHELTPVVDNALDHMHRIISERTCREAITRWWWTYRGYDGAPPALPKAPLPTLDELFKTKVMRAAEDICDDMRAKYSELVTGTMEVKVLGTYTPTTDGNDAS